jgi:hypothetical protein
MHVIPHRRTILVITVHTCTYWAIHTYSVVLQSGNTHKVKTFIDSESLDNLETLLAAVSFQIRAQRVESESNELQD